MLFDRKRRISYERTRRPLSDDRRRAYEAPALEAIGHWRALTLQQTVPITMYPHVSPELHENDPV